MIDPSSPAVRDRLTAALGIPSWVGAVVAGGPYDDVDGLAAASRTAAAAIGDDQLGAAIAHTGNGRPTGAASRLSAGEQAGLARADDGEGAAVARGTAVYEGRFGRAFVIDADGRSPQEVLDELQRRLKNDDATEAAEAKEQLGGIAARRIAALFADPA